MKAHPVPGTILDVSLQGVPGRYFVLEVHPLGTMDIERICDGKRFRISGLTWTAVVGGWEELE